jgi:malonyl-CoA/methylmalonyl-CoA synthetase
MNLHDLFAIPCRRDPGKLALRTAPGGVDLTYEELFGRARRLAAGLAARGIGKGDRVAFFLGNRVEFVVGYLAVLALGAVLVPINLAYRRREIAHMLGDAEPKLLLTEESQLPILAELAAEERRGIEVVLAEEIDRLTGDAAGLIPIIDGDDLALLLYTSGTTGRSKGAMISHANVLATVTDLLAAWAWEREDVLLLALPLFHTHGLVVGLTTALAAGATVHLHARFDAARVASDLAGSGAAPLPTLFFGVPTLYVRLVEELSRSGAGPALGRLRLCCSGSAPLAPEIFAAFRELTGQAILERYGMTETGMNLGNPYAGPRVPGQVGTPFPGVSIRIVDPGDPGTDLAPGDSERGGELLVRGSNVFSGYWRAPEKTAESFLHDSLGRRWFRTGDLARRDPATGAVTLLGRSSELILSGGFNIYPREVEEALVTFPGVKEAAVVGRPHPEWGEVPVAYLVVEREIDEGGLISYLKGQLAGFKVPRTFFYLPALPRNALGKVQKHRLDGEHKENVNSPPGRGSGD